MSFEKPWGNYLLEKIIETQAPESISLWPQTIAWKVIFSILLLIGIRKAYRLWKQYQDNAYRREALAWLNHCSLTNEQDIRQLPTLLRKTALLSNQLNKRDENKSVRDYAKKQHEQITLLSGSAWALWLDEQCIKSQFSQVSQVSPISLVRQSSQAYPMSKLLTELAYTPTLELDNKEFTRALHTLIEHIGYWIKHHQLNVKPPVSCGETS